MIYLLITICLLLLYLLKIYVYLITAKRLAKKRIRNETSTKVHEIKVKGASNGNKKVKVRISYF